MGIIYRRESSRPLVETDDVNRLALATGTPSNATKGMSADYNGHRYVMGRVGTGPRGARRWGVNYIWAGVRWAGTSSDFADALDIGIRALESVASRGWSLEVVFFDEDPTADMMAAMSDRGLARLSSD